MKPIIIISDRFCDLLSVFISVGAITLFPFIVMRSVYDNPITINHEKIHIEQQKELLVVFFYILYVFYWLKGKASGMTNEAAYSSIPFEKEAYSNQYNLEYLDKRKRWNWTKFI